MNVPFIAKFFYAIHQLIKQLGLNNRTGITTANDIRYISNYNINVIVILKK